MLLSPPSPPTRYPFSPQSTSTQHTVAQSPRSALSVATVPSDSYSPIEDYSYSPASVSSLPHSDTSSPNSKTSAFFGSPFATPPQSVSYLSKTAAFFSSPFADSSSPPSRQQYTPRELPSPSRSLTTDFFAPGAFSLCPTSPPSLRSSTSNASLRTSVSRTSSPPSHHATLPSEQSEDSEATPVPKHHVPLLARLFPSRYSSDVRRTDDNHLDSRRGFVTIEPSDDVLVSSPSAIEGHHLTDSPAAAVASPPSGEYSIGALVHPDNEDEPSYELARQIGHGAFSLVWLARWVQGGGVGGFVAVKMISRAGQHGDLAARRAARGERASFVREVEVLSVRAPQPTLAIISELCPLASNARACVVATIVCVIYLTYTSRACS
jgi:protein-serine/threonine kinase